jgi:hypothetical protein
MSQVDDSRCYTFPPLSVLGRTPNDERSHTLILDTILTTLKAERDKIARAIAALQEGTVTAAPASRTAAPATRRKRGRRKMSAEARQRLSDFKRRWWAKRKRRAA